MALLSRRQTGQLLAHHIRRDHVKVQFTRQDARNRGLTGPRQTNHHQQQRRTVAGRVATGELDIVPRGGTGFGFRLRRYLRFVQLKAVHFAPHIRPIALVEVQDESKLVVCRGLLVASSKTVCKIRPAASGQSSRASCARSPLLSRSDRSPGRSPTRRETPRSCPPTCRPSRDPAGLLRAGDPSSDLPAGDASGPRSRPLALTRRPAILRPSW